MSIDRPARTIAPCLPPSSALARVLSCVLVAAMMGGICPRHSVAQDAQARDTELTPTRAAMRTLETERRALELERSTPRPRWGLIVTGSVLLGLGHTIGLWVAADSDFGDGLGWLAIPMLGPWISMTDGCEEDECPAAEAMLVYLGLAILQTTGAVLLLLGAIMPRRSRPIPASRRARERSSLTVVPWATLDAVGVTLATR